MKTNDNMLKWMQRVWLWGATPLLIFVLIGLVSSPIDGLGLGMLLILLTPIFLPLTWPLGAIWILLTPSGLTSVKELYFISGIPLLGYLQWFVFCPFLFKRWSDRSIKMFWKIWVLSALFTLIGSAFLAGWPEWWGVVLFGILKR